MPGRACPVCGWVMLPQQSRCVACQRQHERRAAHERTADMQAAAATLGMIERLAEAGDLNAAAWMRQRMERVEAHRRRVARRQEQGLDGIVRRQAERRCRIRSQWHLHIWEDQDDPGFDDAVRVVEGSYS